MNKLTVDQWTGIYQFEVNANTKDWTVVSDADWAVVTTKQFKGEVVINVAENKERGQTTAKLTLMGADNKSVKSFY